jgi:hypothetical protein
MYQRPQIAIDYEKRISEMSDRDLDREAKRAIKTADIYWKSPLLHGEYRKRKRDAKEVMGQW